MFLLGVVVLGVVVLGVTVLGVVVLGLVELPEDPLLSLLIVPEGFDEPPFRFVPV